MIENNEEKNYIYDIYFVRLTGFFKTGIQNSHAKTQAITATNGLKTAQKKAKKRECD